MEAYVASTVARQFICLTIGPAFLCASIYLCLARIIVVHGQEYSRLKPRTYSILFACSDFLSLLLQSIGGSITGSAKTLPVSNRGIHIMLGGLSFQIFSLLVFMGLWIEFNLRLRKIENVGEKSKVDFSGLTASFKFKAFQGGMFLTYISLSSSMLIGMS